MRMGLHSPSRDKFRQAGCWRRSISNLMEMEVGAVALLVAPNFSHGVVRRRAAVLGMRFDAVLFDH